MQGNNVQTNANIQRRAENNALAGLKKLGLYALAFSLQVGSDMAISSFKDSYPNVIEILRPLFRLAAGITMIAIALQLLENRRHEGRQPEPRVFHALHQARNDGHPDYRAEPTN